MLDDTVNSGMHRRARSPSGEVDYKPPGVLLRRLSAGAVCLVAALVIGWLPAAANAATLPGLSLQYTQAPWASYLPGGGSLPGLGGSGTLPGLGGSGTLPGWASYLPGLGGSTTGGSTTTHPTSAQTSSLPGKLTTGSYTNSAGTRSYELYVPSTYKAGTRMPLVVALHGCTQSAEIFRQLTGWDKLAEAKRFIVVFPQQDSNANYLKCWNFFQSADMSRGSGEPSLIAGITRWVQQHYSVDVHRTYVDGLSAGGAMTSVMAATYPDLYAAAGVGSGCEYAATATCAGYKSADPAQAAQAAFTAMGSYARPMPVIVFQGDADTIVPPINAQQAVQQWDTTDGMAMKVTLPSMPMNTTNGTSPGGQTYTVTYYGDRQRRELIQSWLVHGMNHAWSGGSSTQQYADPSGPDETAAMYAFFANHPMP
jgi:poly(hydroxyalkanoate) depolymerase family esterase